MSLRAVGGFEVKKCYDIRGVAPEDQLYGNSVHPYNRQHRDIRIWDAIQDDGTRIWPNSTDAGRPVDPATMPKLLERVGPKNYPLLDFYSMARNPVVNEAFKQAVEELESGVHQFFKIQIVQEGDKSLRPLTERYWMVICNRLVTLHDTLCEPPLKSNGGPDLSKRGPRRFVFSNQKIGGAHAWYDKKWGDGILISEQLHAKLAALNMSGVKFTAFDVAD
jgi:hypothetical protein